MIGDCVFVLDNWYNPNTEKDQVSTWENESNAINTCLSKNSVVSKDPIFCLLWYNAIR